MEGVHLHVHEIVMLVWHQHVHPLEPHSTRAPGMWFIKLQGRFVSFNILTFTCGYMNFAQSRRKQLLQTLAAFNGKSISTTSALRLFSVHRRAFSGCGQASILPLQLQYQL